jgi:uncharacterized protein YxeA
MSSVLCKVRRSSSMKVSRFDIIKKLIRKEYKKERPTSHQMLEVIRKYDLQRYKSDGKKRSREAMTKAIAKAYKSL